MRTVVEALQPMMAEIMGKGAPASSIRVQAVCRRSWNRHCTPERLFEVSQASFQRPIGLVGSVLCAQAALKPSPVAPYRSDKLQGVRPVQKGMVLPHKSPS